VKHRTGEVAPYRGVYLPDCRCETETTVRVGTIFPPCPVCGKAVVWHFSRSVWTEKGAHPASPIPPSGGERPASAG
jgi:hypothetical protein